MKRLGLSVCVLVVLALPVGCSDEGRAGSPDATASGVTASTGVAPATGGAPATGLNPITSAKPAWPFTTAAFAAQDVIVDGIVDVDAYDSRQADWPASRRLDAVLGANRNISLSGITDVYGSVVAGGLVDIGDEDVTGAVVQGAPQRLLRSAAVLMAEAVRSNDNAQLPASVRVGNDLVADGNDSLVLPAGTYQFENVTITGNVDLVPLGRVTLYVSGDFLMDGNNDVLRGESRPIDLVVVANGNVTLRGNGTVSAAIYAPASVVIFDKTRLYGSIIGFHVALEGNLFFDHALEELRLP